MRHARSLGTPIAILTQQPDSEAAQLADIMIAPQTGPEAVAGYGNPKAQMAQRQILTPVNHRPCGTQRQSVRQPAR